MLSKDIIELKDNEIYKFLRNDVLNRSERLVYNTVRVLYDVCEEVYDKYKILNETASALEDIFGRENLVNPHLGCFEYQFSDFIMFESVQHLNNETEIFLEEMHTAVGDDVKLRVEYQIIGY